MSKKEIAEGVVHKVPADLQQQIASWESKEKDRVKRSLESGCLELKKRYESSS